MSNLQVVPKSWAAWSYNVLQDGNGVAAIRNASMWKDKAVLEIGGTPYEVSREHLMSGQFLLQQNGATLAYAQKPGVFRNSIGLMYQGKQYTLKKESAFRRSFVLSDQGREVGSVRPAGLFTRKANVSLPEELPLPVQIFVIWLVLVLWKHQQNAAVAAASGA